MKQNKQNLQLIEIMMTEGIRIKMEKCPLYYSRKEFLDEIAENAKFQKIKISAKEKRNIMGKVLDNLYQTNYTITCNLENLDILIMKGSD